MAITWTYEGTENETPLISGCIQSIARYFSMVMESDEALQNVFFYVDTAYSGVVSAKRSTQSTYRSIGPYSFTPSCFIGNIGASVEVQIDFKLSFPVGTTWIGDIILPIKLGYGPNISSFYSVGTEFFWRPDSTDDPFFWLDSPAEADEYSWRGDY